MGANKWVPPRTQTTSTRKIIIIKQKNMCKFTWDDTLNVTKVARNIKQIEYEDETKGKNGENIALWAVFEELWWFTLRGLHIFHSSFLFNFF